MKKMPPPGKMPPNGSGSSPHNGRADELSHGERIAQLEVLIQNCATKTDSANLRAEMAELRGEMAELRGEMVEFKGEMKAEMAELRSEMRTEMAELRSEMKTEMAALRVEMAALRADMHANFVSTLRWTLGVLLGVIVPFFSAVLAILKFL